LQAEISWAEGPSATATLPGGREVLIAFFHLTFSASYDAFIGEFF